MGVSTLQKRLAASQIGCPPSTVRVYDSLYSELSTQTKEQICALLASQETSQQIPAKSLKKQLFSSLKVSHEVEFTSYLEDLKVQSKLLDSIDLESSSKIWKRIIRPGCSHVSRRIYPAPKFVGIHLKHAQW